MALTSSGSADLADRTQGWAAVGVAIDLAKLRQTVGRTYEPGDHRCLRCKLKCAVRRGAVRIARGRKRSYLCAACARMPFPPGWSRADE